MNELITQHEWEKALKAHRFMLSKGERLGRRILADLLEVSDRRASQIMFAIKNRKVINFDPVKIETDEDRELIISDLHFPFQDDISIESTLRFADSYKPTIITILGDAIDFYKISRFCSNPNERNISSEMKLLKTFLSELRARFPKAKIIYLKGNHEDRLDRYIYDNAPEISDLLEDLFELKMGFSQINVEYKIKFFKIGKLWHIHGHEKPGGAYNAEYITNVIWKYTHDNTVVGHFHRGQEKVFKSIGGKVYWVGACGYLAGDMDYAKLNNWTQGFITVNYGKDGYFNPKNFSIFDGMVRD